MEIIKHLDKSSTMKGQRIHAVHLLNDFSGSPLVFREALNDMLTQGASVELYTATPSGNGFLSNMQGANENPIFYKWSPNKFVTLAYFILSQVLIFFKIMSKAKKNDIVYVNTLLPFGALWAGKIKGCHVKLHVHEISLKPASLKGFLVWCAEKCADQIIFVSKYVRSQYHFKKPTSEIVLNKLPKEFVSRAEQAMRSGIRQETVLMLCSLKAYKGIYEFIDIARSLPQIPFELVLNASAKDVTDWMKSIQIPSNCIVFHSQSDTHSFYQRARVVMNLSRPTEWVETFGMTVLEAMAYNAFVIVPPVGGPVELLETYDNGVAIDGKETNKITSVILKAYSTKSTHVKLVS